jgi:uncharacterized RDD family membrane protein YckC
MDPQELEDAKARLERDYLAGSISADEYTRLRRQLHESVSKSASEPAPDPEPELESIPEPETIQEPVTVLEPVWGQPAPGFQPPVSAGADPVTGARLASWGQRAAAWFVDVMVFVAALVAGETAGVASSVALVFGPALYAWLMVGRWGQTLGKMALGIRVVRSEDGERVSYLRALGRAASVWVLALFALPLLLAYLWPLWDKRNQTLYDKMASTIVVRDR